MLPDIAELEYVVRRPETQRPRARETQGPGGEDPSQPEVVDISQDEEDFCHEVGHDLNGRPSPCVVEHIEIEESQVEDNPVARTEDGASIDDNELVRTEDGGSNDDNELVRTEDYEVDELLKDDDSPREESHSFNFESGAQSPDMEQITYSTPCLSPLDLSKSADVEIEDVEEPKEDEAQSTKAVSDTSFLDAVNQDFTEVSNDSNYDETLHLQAEIDNIVEQQTTSMPIKLNKTASKTDISNESLTITEELIKICDTDTAEGNDLPKEPQDQIQKKRSKRKSSPRSPKRKKQKSAPDIEPNFEQPPPEIQNEGNVKTSPADKFLCPIEDCSYSHSTLSSSSHPHVYYILKHFISEHLGSPPLKLYDFKRFHKKIWPCRDCNYTNESKTSIFAHMAFEHQNLSERIAKDARNILKDPSAMKIIDCIDDYLTLNWVKWTSCEQLFADASKNENAQVLYEENFIVEAPVPVSEELVFTENTVIPVDLDDCDDTQNESHIVLKHPSAVEERDIFCRACLNFKFEDIDGLRRHVLEKHSGDYEEVPLLEAGEKYYECNLCSHFKRNKSKMVFMKHLKKGHKKIYRGLLDSDEAWNEGVLCETDFCSPGQETQQSIKTSAPADLSVLHDCNPLSSGPSSPLSSPGTSNPFASGPGSPLGSPPTAPPPPVLRENPLFSPEEEGEEDQSPKSSSEDDNVSIIEDYAFINPKKRRGTPDLGSSCKVCDMEFSHPREVSRHVFLTHLEHHKEITNEVWRCLYATKGETQTYVCSVCNCEKENEQFAKLHIYNKHKRNLKKMMDKKKIDWKNLLDFIGYNISERSLQEDESDFEMEDLGNNSPGIAIATTELNIDSVSKADKETESIETREEGEIRDEDTEKNLPSLYRCPLNGCKETFPKSKSGKRQLLTHYLTTHRESTLAYQLVETLMPGKIPFTKDVTVYKVNLNNDGRPEVFHICSCLATFRTEQALEDHQKLCLPNTAEMLQERCKHCLGIFKFCSEHIAQECAHIDELKRIRDLTA